MQTKKHTDKLGARRPLVSPAETTFWAVLSVAGWVLVAALVWILGPDQASQTATDEAHQGHSGRGAGVGARVGQLIPSRAAWTRPGAPTGVRVVPNGERGQDLALWVVLHSPSPWCWY